MAIDVTSLIRQLLLLYDPTLDVTPGSRLDTTVIVPMSQRIEPQLTQTSAASFLRARLVEAYPELDGYGFEDSTFQPAQVLTTTVQRELARVEAILTSPRYENLTLEEARLRAAQFFVYGADGTRTQVSIRVYFATLRDRTVPLDAVFYGTNNLRYYPISPRNVLSEEQEQDYETGEYYVDVLCYAENTGSRYNVQPGVIRVVNGIPGAARCNNLSSSTVDGVDGDTQSTLYNKVLNTAERSLTKVGGITLFIEETFPSLYDKVRVVRAGDEEMVRDRLRIVLELIGDPVMYVGRDITSLSGFNGIAGQLEPYPGLTPDVTNKFVVPSTVGMEVGDVITVTSGGMFDLPILDIDEDVTTMTLDSVDFVTFGTDLYVAPYVVYGGADLLRSDILSLHAGAQPAGTGLTGSTGDRIYTQSWPTVGTAPTTYDLVVSGGHHRVGPVIVIIRKELCTPFNVADYHVVMDYSLTEFGFPIGPSNPPADLVGKLITVKSYGEVSGDPINTYELEINGLQFDGTNWFVTALKSTPGVLPALVGDWYDFTIHTAGPDFILPGHHDPSLSESPVGDTMWTIYTVRYGELQPGLALPYQYRRSASVDDFRFRVNGQEYEDYIKLGGMTDVYLRDRQTGEEAAVLDVIPDNDPVYKGPCELIATVTDFSIVTIGFDTPVARNDMLFLEAGCDDDDIGAHRIIEVLDPDEFGGLTVVRIPVLITTPTATIECHVSRDIKFDIFAPEELHASGTDMITMLESSIVKTAVDLSDINPNEDLVRILNGPDAGEYAVIDISAPYIKTDGVFGYHTEDLGFEIFSPAGTIVKKPLVRVTEVSREGSLIPYAYPSISYLIRSVTSQTKIPSSLYPGNDASTVDASRYVNFDDVNPIEAGVSVGDYLSLSGSWYRITEVESNRVRIDTALGDTLTDLDYSIGSPSRGTLRMLFTESVASWLPNDQWFSYGESGSILFQADPIGENDVISVVGGTTVALGTFTSLSTDLVDSNVQVGDKLYVKTRALLSADFPAGVNIAGATLAISIAGVTYQIFFTGVNPIPLTQLSPQGVVEQVATAIPGLDVWAYGDKLAIRSDLEVEILPSTGATILNFAVTTNTLAVPKSFVVEEVLADVDTVGGTITHNAVVDDVTWNTGTDLVNASFVRVGGAFVSAVQRDDELYQADVEIESIGFGEAFDLSGGEVLTAQLPLEGFSFEDVDEGLSYSVRESGNLVVRSVVPIVGSYALMDKMTVKFRHAPNISSLQSTLDDDSVRSLGNDILVKTNHEAPVHRSLEASGVTTTELISQGARNYIRDLAPNEELEVFDFHSALKDAGARDVTLPTPFFMFYEDALRRRQGVVIIDSYTPPRSVMPVVGFIG